MSTPKTVRFIAQHHPSRPRLFGLGWTQHPHQTLFAIATLPDASADDVDDLVKSLNQAMFDEGGLQAVEPKLSKLPPAIRSAIVDAFPDTAKLEEIVPDFATLWRVKPEDEDPDSYYEGTCTNLWTPRTVGLLWHSARFEFESAQREVDEAGNDAEGPLWIFGSLPEPTRKYSSAWRQRIVDVLQRMAGELAAGERPTVKTLADAFAWLEIVEGAKADDEDGHLVEYIPWMLELPAYENDFKWDEIEELDGRLDYEEIEYINFEAGADELGADDWFVERDW